MPDVLPGRVTCNHFNRLRLHSNAIKKVIDKQYTFVLFSSVFIEFDPRLFTRSLERLPLYPPSPVVFFPKPFNLQAFQHSNDVFPAPSPALPRNSLVPLSHSPTSLNHLESTLMKYSVSVASKELTESLKPLESTLTKNRGRGFLWLTRNPISVLSPPTAEESKDLSSNPKKARGLRPGGDHEVPVAGNFYPEEHRDEGPASPLPKKPRSSPGLSAPITIVSSPGKCYKCSHSPKFKRRSPP
jgi:hypothetical protein